MNPNTWRIVLDVGVAVFVVAVGIALAWWSLRKSVDPVKLLLKWILTVAIVAGMISFCQHLPPVGWPILMVPVGIALAIIWAPSIGSMLISPLTNAIDGGDIPLEAQPFYSMAKRKRRNGHPQEAMTAVRQQLEKFPGDLHGTLLLASIQAEDMNDLPGAQLTLERWMEGPWATPHHRASVLTTMADWHLQFAQDPEAARLALEKIVELMPGTPAAHHAAQRLAHLPTVADLVAARTGAPVDLRPGESTSACSKITKARPRRRCRTRARWRRNMSNNWKCIPPIPPPGKNSPSSMPSIFTAWTWPPINWNN